MQPGLCHTALNPPENLSDGRLRVLKGKGGHGAGGGAGKGRAGLWDHTFINQPYDLEQPKVQRPPGESEKGRERLAFRLSKNHGMGQPAFNMLP